MWVPMANRAEEGQVSSLLIQKGREFPQIRTRMGLRP